MSIYEFEVEDTVWYLEEGKAVRGKVINVTFDDVHPVKSYDVQGEDGGVIELEDFEAFPTPEALAREIFEDYEPEDIDIELAKV